MQWYECESEPERDAAKEISIRWQGVVSRLLQFGGRQSRDCGSGKPAFIRRFSILVAAGGPGGRGRGGGSTPKCPTPAGCSGGCAEAGDSVAGSDLSDLPGRSAEEKTKGKRPRGTKCGTGSLPPSPADRGEQARVRLGMASRKRRIGRRPRPHCTLRRGLAGFGRVA